MAPTSSPRARGNDSVSYYGSETSIDGGAGTNTLVLRAAGTINLGNADQIQRRFRQRHQFPERRCIRAVLGGSITGSSGANTITGGTGADTIDGAGGADVIAAGGGNDTVTYRGTEISIDGGAGTDTLVLAATGGTTAVNFAVAAGSDQTTGDSVSITNFESVDASALQLGPDRYRLVVGQYDHDRLRQRHASTAAAAPT